MQGLLTGFCFASSLNPHFTHAIAASPGCSLQPSSCVMAVPGLRPGGKLLWVCIHQAVALLYLPELCQAGKQPARQLALCPLQPNAAIFHTYFREAIFLQSLSGGQVLHTHRCECREATYPWRNKKQDRRLRKKQCQTGYVASQSAVRSGDRDL